MTYEIHVCDSNGNWESTVDNNSKNLSAARRLARKEVDSRFSEGRYTIIDLETGNHHKGERSIRTNCRWVGGDHNLF